MVFPCLPAALRALPRGPLSKRAVKEQRRTKPPPPPVERLSARLRYLSPLLLENDRDKERKREREKGRKGGTRGQDTTLSSVSPSHVEINDVPSTKDACLKRSTLLLALPPFRLCQRSWHVAGCSGSRAAHVRVPLSIQGVREPPSSGSSWIARGGRWLSSHERSASYERSTKLRLSRGPKNRHHPARFDVYPNRSSDRCSAGVWTGFGTLIRDDLCRLLRVMASYETSPSGNTDSIFVDVPVINIKGWIGSGTPRRRCRVCIPFPFTHPPPSVPPPSSRLFLTFAAVARAPPSKAATPKCTHVRSNALNIASR